MSSIQDFPGVQVVSVMQKPTRSGRMMYEVTLSNGMTPSAFDAALATKAHQLTGQPVTARIEQTDKGYFNLKDIGAGALGGGAAAAPFGAPAAAPFGSPAAAPAQGFGQQGVGPQFPDANALKEARIIRGNGVNAGATLFAGVYTGQPEVEDDYLLTRILRFAGAFEHFIKTGQNIATAAQSAAALTVPEATPAAVADAVNAVAPGAVQVGAPVEQAAPVEAPAAETQQQAVPW